MSRKAAMYYEPAIEGETLDKVKNKTVTIRLDINPDSKTFKPTRSDTEDIWPGDTLEWKVKGKAGTSKKLKDKTLVIALSRIGDTPSAPCPSEDFSRTDTLASTLSVGDWHSTDGPADVLGDPHKGVGFSVTLDGADLTPESGATTFLVIDTSGPPTQGGSGGGTGRPIHWPKPHHPRERKSRGYMAG